MYSLLDIPIYRDIKNMQLCGLWQLRRYPRQSVLSHTEDVQTSAATDLSNTGDKMRLQVSHGKVLWSIKMHKLTNAISLTTSDYSKW